MFNEGANTRDYTYINDAVAAVINAVKYTGDMTVDVGGGKPISTTDLLTMLIGITKKDTDIKFVEAIKGDVVNTCSHDTLNEYHTPLYQGLVNTVAWYEDYYGA